MAEAGQATVESESMGGSKYRQIMATSAVHYLACWALIYVGVEVTLGGAFPSPLPPRMTRNFCGADEMSGRMGRLDRDVH